MINIADDLNKLNQFLGLHDYQVNQHYDLILVLGSATPCVALRAYQLYKNKQSNYFMIAGGKGHTTDLLIKQIDNIVNIDCIQDKSEAYLLKQLIESVYQKDQTIILEENSQNCGQNIQYAFQILHNKNLKIQTVLLCHDPLMQRRIDATARNQFPQINFYNYCTFVPEVMKEEYRLVLKDKIWGQWPIERYLSIILGEIKRLIDNENGYGPNGKNFIEHVDVPDDIIEAYQHVIKDYSYYLRD